MDTNLLLKRKKFYKWMLLINVILYAFMTGFFWIVLTDADNDPHKIARPIVTTIWVAGFLLSTWVTVLRPYLQIKKLLKNQ
jgi:hypothetical protein